jgi:hypothetical protein
MYHKKAHYLFITIVVYRIGLFLSHTSYLIFPCDTRPIFAARDYTIHFVFSVAVSGLSLSAGVRINIGSIYPVGIEV